MAPAVGSWVTTPWKPERTVWESAKRRVPWALVSPCRSPRVISPVAPVKPVGFSFSLRPVGRAPRAMAMPVPPPARSTAAPRPMRRRRRVVRPRPGSSVVVVSVLMNSSVDVETGASYYSLRADPAPGTGGRAAEPISSSSSSRSLRAIANKVRTIDATATSPVPRLLI